MAGLAEIVRAEAKEAGLAAAKHAFPDNVLRAVLLTRCLTRAHLLMQAVLAEQIFRLIGLFISLVHLHLLLAVNESAEIGGFALEALVERALMHGELLGLLVVFIALGFQSLVLEDTLSLRIEERLGFDFVLQTPQWPQLFRDRI